MAYITAVAPRRRSLLLRAVYWMGRRLKRTPEQIGIMAHAPILLFGYGMLEQAMASRPRVDAHLRSLAELKAAALIGCEFCLDIGSPAARMSGISDDQLRELHRYSDSDYFDERECLVLDLTVAMSHTPPHVEPG